MKPAAFLILGMAGFIASPSAGAAELMKGRCHMDYCSWFSIESRDLVGSNARGALFKVELKGWTSHHPRGDYGRRSPRTGGETSTGYVFCSKKNPAAIWDEDAGHWSAATLNLASPSGAEENAVIQYFAVCHGIQSGQDAQSSFESLAARFGYGKIATDLKELKRPEDILTE